MARENAVQTAASLRALTYRVTSCPPKQLPHIAPQIAASLWNCRSILSSPAGTLKAHQEISQAVTRFRTCLSSLLQSRTVEERWAALVLTKAAVEAGRLEVVGKATGWVKNLLAILKKNDPSTTKVLATITLTRLFVLTWDDVNLVREIATPNLPGFAQSCLGVIEKPHAEPQTLEVVLQAFAILLPRHPTIFRTYEGRIRALLLRILSTTPSNAGPRSYSEAHCDAARKLFALLHHCAPKQGGANRWDESLKVTITAAHASCGHIFRSINESQSGKTKTSSGSVTEMESNTADAAGLSAWSGVHAGAERLIVLLGLLDAHLKCTISATVAVRIGTIMELLTRILEVDCSIREQPNRFDAQLSKDERESMFNLLPDIHVAALNLVKTILDRFGSIATAAISSFLELLCNISAAEKSNTSLRTASYEVLNTILRLIGPSLSKDSVADLSLVVRTCCDDLLSSDDAGSAASLSQASLNSQRKTSGNSVAKPTHKTSQHSSTFPELQATASALLPLLFSTINQSHLPARLRTRMEQVAILTRQKDALIACVLNPASKTKGAKLRPSLMPLLAREFPESAEVEALLRPRMPHVGGSDARQAAANQFNESEDESEGEDDVSGQEHVDEVEIQDDVAADLPERGSDLVEATTKAPDATRPAHGESTTAGVASSMDDEFFSTAPERSADASPAATQQLNKRSAPDAQPADGSNSKRLRASPVASSLASETAQSLPGADPASVGMAGVPVPVAVGNSMEDVPADDVATTGQVGADNGGGSDDSDFEIPPLTMEMSDEEDEDED